MTYQERAKRFIPLLQAIAEGKTVQRECGGGAYPMSWVDVGNGLVTIIIEENPDRYRIKPEPKPVEYIPLGPEDVPPGSVIRQIGADSWGMVTCGNDVELAVANIGTLTFDKLQYTYEIKRPGEDWQPCRKVKPE